MKFFSFLAIVFYVIIISLMGGVAILFVSHVIMLADVTAFLEMADDDSQTRIIVGSVGCVLILLSWMFARVISGRYHKEKTIAFDNPGGRVTVSLNAMEDMVRRLIMRSGEIKEARSNIKASKKGLIVEARLILKADVNIPELTMRLQDLVKNRVQDTIGIEEQVIVRIHVVKMIFEDSKIKRKGKDDLEETSSLPFQGYRA